jgi:hypothetical protein
MLNLGLENLADEPATPPVIEAISLEEAEEIFADVEAMHAQHSELMELQLKIITMIDTVSEHGITDTFKAIYGEELAAVNIDLDSIGEEGLVGALGDFMQGLTKRMYRIQGFFEDKFKSLVDAHYAGIKYLTKFKKEKGATIGSMDSEKFDSSKVRVYKKADFEAFLKSTDKFIAVLPGLLKKQDITTGKELTPFLTPLGHGVNVRRSKIFGYEYATLIKTTGFPEAEKGTTKALGYGLSDITSLCDKVLKTLDSYTYLNDIYANAFKAYMAEAQRLEKELAKGNPKEVAEGKLQLDRYNWSMNFQVNVGMLQFQAVRQLSKQMIQLTKKVK